MSKDANTSDSNNNQVNDSSYHLKLVGFEDSQIDHFIPYSSPSILYWQTNKKLNRNYFPDTSDIEQKRGNPSDLSTTKIEQIPAENTIDLQTERKKPNGLTIKSDQKMDFLSTSKIAPLSSRSDLMNFDMSSLRNNSNIDLNRSKTLADLENNVQKRLEFLDITENDAKENNYKQNQAPPVIKIDQPDETGEILLELSCDSEDEEVNEEDGDSRIETTFDSELNYYKIIDQKMDEMRRKKLDLLSKENKKAEEGLKNSVAWEITSSTTTLKSNIVKKTNSEVSTQTSFVQPIQARKLITEESKRSPLSQLRFDFSQQKKFKTMIEAQKHEKRYKELELLAKLERLQAERLRKLIMENTSEDSSLIADSYFHSTTSNLDCSVDATRLESMIKKLETKNRRKSEFIRPSFSRHLDELSLISEADSVLSSKQSQVEVLNLKNTSVYEQPKSVKIIKENEIRKSASDSKELRKNFVEKENRGFFSDLNNVRNQLKHCQSDPGFQKRELESPSSSAVSKISLQDAFLIFKKDLIERSQKRVKEIEERSQMRQIQAEYERKQAQITMKLKEVHKKLTNTNRITAPEIPRKRTMSSQEIRNLTRKNYEKLPEVKQKQQKERLEQTKKLNLIKSSIYKKTIQQRVLTKGPNFGLNYKALQN